MELYKIILLLIFSYLLGSIPSSYWIGKIFFNVDVRNHGSKSSGATNTMRILGAKVAFPVLLIDILKGFLATKLTILLPNIAPDIVMHYKIFFGLAAITGHIFPVFANFRGGKGIATITGIIIGIIPELIPFALGLFIIIVSFTKIVSMGSILTSLSVPFIIYFILQRNDIYLLGFSLIIFLIVIITHRENLKRIFAGKETTISFRKNN
ncbi:MAG: glycerol-3-phosphate 1-O-acyltransferase PlsY [Bacteroidota bacterium]|nr:glycerol-3-phosphate 1-O-acyltransferase PlsY [Bacteroidota bacterium]